MNACLVMCDVIAEHCLAIMIPHCGDQNWAVEAYFWAVASAPGLWSWASSAQQ